MVGIDRDRFTRRLSDNHVRFDLRQPSHELKTALDAAGIDVKDIEGAAMGDHVIEGESEYRALYDRLAELGGAKSGSTMKVKGDIEKVAAFYKTFASGTKKQAKLEELAALPYDAHHAWKNLGSKDRAKVLELMEKRYGKDFVAQFEDAQKHPKKQSDLTRTYGPGVGPSEKKLRADGFKPYARGQYNEIWVHPSGEMVQKVLDQGASKTGGKTVAPQTDPWVEDAKDTVAGMKAWLDELKTLDPKSDEYAEAYTDFWVQLTQEHDDLKNVLQNTPDLDATTRAGLEEQLKEYEALNQERKNSLPSHVTVPSKTSVTQMDDWIYMIPD